MHMLARRFSGGAILKGRISVMTALFAVFPYLAHAAGEGLSIHLAPTIVGHIAGIPITNTLITVWLVMLVLVVFSLVVRKKIKMVPGKFQLLLEEMIGYSYNYVTQTLENKELARKVFPLIMTLFIFILAANWIGLLPGVDAIGYYDHEHGSEFIPLLHPAMTDLNITLALTLVAFFAIEFIGVMLLGFLKYTSKFVNFRSPMGFAVGIIELFSELARLVSFSFRLFGNIFAGKTLILVAMFFVPFFLPVPLLAFELFVGFIQAFIFAILTLFFIKLAKEAPH